MPKKNVLLLVRSLYISVGGVERMSIEIANELSLKGYKVFILTWDNDLDQKIPLDFYKIDNSISVIRLNYKSILKKNNTFIRIRRIFKIRRILIQEKIDLILAFVEGCYWNALLAAVLTKIKIIALERTSPQRFEYISLKKYKLIIMNLFRFAHKITVQFPSYKDIYPSYLHKKIKVIPNAVSTINLKKDCFDKKEKIILCVGRTCFQKNLKSLIKAFSLIKNKKGWKLFLITDNKDHEITKLIKDLDLEKDTKVIKPLSDISNFYLKASIFCLPSYYEGFPNALAEAMSFGLACVGFNECSGVNELIINNETGLLANGINNAKNLKNVINILMNNRELRIKLGINARKFISSYIKKDIYQKWVEIIS